MALAAKNAGSAFVKIRPDATDFVRDLRRDLKAVKDPGFVIDVSADTSQATADIRRFRDVQKRDGVRLGVDVALGQAQADLAAFRARQRADGMVIAVDADTGKARAEVAAFRRQIESLGRSDAFRINIAAAGISLLPTAAAGFAQVAAAMQQVVQVGLAVPGAIGAATSSIGTLAFGLSGVIEAWDALSAAADSAGQDQESSARAGVSASNQLRNAVVDLTQARQDQARATRDARQQLQDLNIEMRGGLISESRALLEAQKAREDLAKGDYSDIRDQVLRIAEADQRVLEVRSRNQQVSERLADANAKGIENSDLVVAANERVVRAEQQVADAHNAVADAAFTSQSAQKKAAEMLGRVHPNAKAFLEVMDGLRPVIDDLRNKVEGVGFDGLADRLKSAATTVVPVLEKGLTEIAAGWNENFDQLFTSIGSEEGRGLIDRILGNTAEAQSRFTAAIDPLVQGVGTLAAAGTEVMPRVADAIGGVAERFERFVTQADQDGRLDQWINDSLTGIGNLAETMLNLGKTWTAITRAAGGGALLDDLERLTSRLQTFLNSTQGQDKLRQFFDDGREMLESWRPILEALPGLFQGIYEGASKYMGGVLDAVAPLVEFLSDHPTLVATAIAAWAGWKTLSPIIGGVQNTLMAFSSAVTMVGTGFYPMRDNAKRAMSEVDDVFVKAGRGGSGLSKFSGALSALGGSAAGAGIMGALATVAIPGLVYALQQLDRQNEESEAKTRLLEQAQKDLEATVDRVTGKLTRQSREELINKAQNYDTTGTPGGGIPGISKGNGVTAAESLGIAPDLYADALEGRPEAVQQVRDILLKNNLLPEFSANQDLSKLIARIGEVSGGVVTPDLVASALIGDPGSVKQYNDVVSQIRDVERGDINIPGLGGISLTDLAKVLSQTGQASVLSGGALNLYGSTAANASAAARQANEASYGRARIKPGSGMNSPFPEDAQVSVSDNGYQVVVPGNFAGQLQMQGIPFITNLDGTLTATVPLDSPYIEKYEQGGLVPGRGPRVAILHGGELVVPAPAVARIPGFEQGGTVDEFGNPIHGGTGAMPGPAPAVVPTVPGGGLLAPVAANPLSRGPGLISNLIGGITSGVQGPISNAMSLVTAIPGVAQSLQGADSALQIPSLPGLTKIGTPEGNFASRMAQVPGLAGLFGSLASPDPVGSSMQWAGQTLNWLGNWGASTISEGAGILWQGGLDAVGLGGSILSPSNPWNQAGQQVAGFALGSQGPLAAMLGAGGQGGGGSAATTDIAALAKQYGITLDDAMLNALYSGASTTLPADLSSLPTRLGGEGGLQINTINVKRAIEAMFPEITEIGGYRQDALKWHPNGLAIDVMIPGAGGLNDPTPPEGKALGDRIYQFVMANKDRFGVDYVMWQERDHYNHLHINTTGGGYPSVPGMAEGGPTPSRRGPGPTGGYIAEVHPDEFIISARGRANVPDEFLHRLNAGLVDPKELAGFAPGGPVQIRQGLVVPPPGPPRPVVPDAQMKIPPRPVMATPAPAPAPATVAPAAPAAPAAPPPAAQAPAAAQSPAAAAPQRPITQGVAEAPDDLNHNLDWINTAIHSTASTMGNAAATAMQIGASILGAAGGGGAAASFGGSLGASAGAAALGGASSYVAGLFQQGGKITEKLVNVVSSALVGSAPGNYGDPNMPASGRLNIAEQNRPSTAPYNGFGGAGGNQYSFHGYDMREVFQMAQNNEALERQARLATVRG